MQEIATHVFIETGYAGVTLGMMDWPHGLVLIDAPFRPEDTRAWRAALSTAGAGSERLLVNLDAHFDRTLGARAMDAVIVGQEKMAAVFRTRPISFKTAHTETGAAWEQFNGLGSIRWAPPELTFSDQMTVHWGHNPLVLEHHPGPATGACWAILPEERIIFLGDAVVVEQPPFLSFSEIPVWCDTLEKLQAKPYLDYTLVSGRGGVLTHKQVRAQINYLKRIQTLLEGLAEKQSTPEDTAHLVPKLLGGFEIPAELEKQYQHRLRWGLRQYYARHYRPASVEVED